MGTWGPGLYQNDLSEDVKSDFMDQLHRGKKAEQITKDLVEAYKEALLDDDDRANFWLALADVQWDMGRLLPDVREHALKCLKDGSDSWEMAANKDVVKRRLVLNKLRQKLDSKQPQEKKVSQYRLYQCPWQIGDVFALPLESEQSKALGLKGDFLLLEKAGERIYHPGHHIPIVYVKISRGQMLPDSVEAYQKLNYLKISTTQIDVKWLKSFDPSNRMFSDDDQLIQKVDEKGNLTEYRISIITTSARTVPKKLIYLGNFPSCPHPAKEYIPDMAINLVTSTWKDLEKTILSRYIHHSHIAHG